MNIAALNPSGYEAKTKNGNTYKKTNNWTTGLIASSVVTETLPYVLKNPKAKAIASGFSVSKMMPDIFKLSSGLKMTPQLRRFAIGSGFVMCFAIDFITGRMLNKAVNKKRAENADKNAETAQIA